MRDDRTYRLVTYPSKLVRAVGRGDVSVVTLGNIAVDRGDISVGLEHIAKDRC